MGLMNGKQLRDATVADAKLATLYTKADGTRAFTGDQSMGGNKIKNLGDAVAATDAVNLQTATALSIGLREQKDPVRVATIAALPANTRSGNVLTADANGALPAINGVTLVVDDSLLVKDEATGANNGIYVVTAVGDGSNPFVLTRRADADSSSEVQAGMRTWANEGAAAGTGDSGYVLTTNDPITLNTTALSFSKYTGLGQVTAGNRATATGNTINVNAIVEKKFDAEAVALNADFVDVLDSTPVVASEVEMFVNGQRQIYGASEDFTISGTTVHWCASADWAIETTDEVSFRYERVF